ncbi:hypothetical protein FHS85_001228 [Rhodoligotrophos appendicifer]
MLLEHVADRLAAARGLAHHRDPAALDGEQSGDEVEQRALSASAGTHDRQEFAVANNEVDAVENVRLLPLAVLDGKAEPWMSTGSL